MPVNLPNRRAMLLTFGSLAALPAIPDLARAATPSDTNSLDPVLLDLHRRTFDFFWETTDDATGLTPDRWPTRAFCSIASVGYALTAYCIGVKSGYVSRADAARRTHNTLNTFWTGKQGAEESGCIGYKGFFYHFLTYEDGTRYKNCELSSVDTTWFLMGALTAAAFFDGNDPAEVEIRDLARKIYERVDWTFMLRGKDLLSMGWHPDKGLITHDWRGYCEGMAVYLLALASPTHAVTPKSWAAWCKTNDKSWSANWGEPHLGFWPLFGHQYSHVWFDFRGVADAYMRGKKSDYFRNSKLATEAQRDYAIKNPGGFKDYSGDIWGLTACDGPADIKDPKQPKKMRFRTYSARGPVAAYDKDSFDDGTIAPTAAISSIVFTPELSTNFVHALRDRYGEDLYDRYGFHDAFNPSFPADLPSKYGHATPRAGWVSTDYIGIDQGPILAMLENHRSGFVWETLKANGWTGALIRTGMTRAGFTAVDANGKWLTGGQG